MQIRFSSRKDSKSTVYNVLIKIDPKSSYHFVPVITNENTALKFHSLIGCSEGLVDMVNSKSLKMPKG